VAVVADPRLASRVEDLANKVHVWAVRSPDTEAIALRHGTKNTRTQDADPLASGVTLFNGGSSGPEDDCVGIIDVVEEHHGEYSHDPPLSAVEVLGAAPTERLRGEFHSLGFTRIEPTAEGFVAFRDI